MCSSALLLARLQLRANTRFAELLLLSSHCACHCPNVILELCVAGEQAVGARPYRVAFAAISLPLALLAVVYFINHRYDGIPLWNVRGMPGVHELIFFLNFVSFFFLYPSTFNLLEVWTLAGLRCRKFMTFAHQCILGCSSSHCVACCTTHYHSWWRCKAKALLPVLSWLCFLTATKHTALTLLECSA